MASISSVLKTLINIKNFVWEDAKPKDFGLCVATHRGSKCFNQRSSS